MKYLLDTNAVIAVLNDSKSAVALKLKQKRPEEVGISGQAVARGLVLVTNNLREFQRVPNLQVEDWSV